MEEDQVSTCVHLVCHKVYVAVHRHIHPIHNPQHCHPQEDNRCTHCSISLGSRTAIEIHTSVALVIAVVAALQMEVETA